MAGPAPLRLTTGIAASVLLVVVLMAWWDHRPAQPDPTGAESARPAPAGASIANPPPDIRALAARLGPAGMAPLTPAQRAEERQTYAEQAAIALAWLRSTERHVRVEGAEQLGAYPTAEAGKALAKSLAQDPSPEVRAAAAASLAYFQRPGEAAIRNLLAALRDVSAEVRQAALGTLEVYIEVLDADSATRRRILRELGKLAKSRRLDPEMKADLRELLADR